DAAQAVDAYRAVLDISPDHSQAIEELERLYKQENQWFELAELLNLRIERTGQILAEYDTMSGEMVAGDPTSHSTLAESMVEYRMRLADVMETRLDDIPGAIDQYETVLASDNGWQRALAPLERLILNEDHRERIAALLEPVYRANDWWQKLVVILDAQVAYATEPERRVAILREVARIHETRGGDPNLALDALSRAWLDNVHDGEIYDELSALAAKMGAWDKLVETMTRGIDDEYDSELVSSVTARIAEIHEHQRGDMEAAIVSWTKVSEIADDNPDALSALDRLLGSEGRFEELVAILGRRADLAEDDSTRLIFLHRIATLREDVLDQRDGAISAYKAVLTVDESDREALDALER
ncbi:MAG: hypothetical protein AAGC55_33700, partial [Myxococcota bacterium]